MNTSQLSALVWLRWRLMANQIRRGGAMTAVPVIAITIVSLLASGLMFAMSLVLGLLLFPRITTPQLLFAWDGLVVTFSFFWMIGLLTELQRTETLTISKFLHLPISVNGAFLINYVSSLLRVSMVIFLPGMIGCWLALIWAQGPAMVLGLPLIVAFLLMVTALTYQFQGWLATLMANPRRRRTIIVVSTLVFVLVFQLPYLLNVFGGARIHERAAESRTLLNDLKQLEREATQQAIGPAELVQRQNELIERHQQAAQQADRAREAAWERAGRIANVVIPLGWLPLGILSIAEANWGIVALAMLGMTLIGSASLWRAYHTTLRIYQGQYTAARMPVARPARASSPASLLLVERHVPWFSEPVSAIALTGFRSLLRAPESKMMLLSPVLLTFIFGSMLYRHGLEIPPPARPFLGVAAMAVVLFGMLQLMANQFGFDRDGFRVFVLCPVPRRDILLGKNLSFLPFAVAMAATMLALVQWVVPLRIDHLLAMIPQFLSMFFFYCPVANVLSIYAPMHIAAGTMKPSNPRLLPIFLQLFLVAFLVPLFQLPTLLPLAVETVLVQFKVIERVPVFLLLAVLECGGVLLVYRLFLTWQGELLERREQAILQTVTSRPT
ncbi:MAG: ABC transporter permease [Pirellulales bacterium]|nr:ABC transporter permease [Pirellulales bacterium]